MCKSLFSRLINCEQFQMKIIAPAVTHACEHAAPPLQLPAAGPADGLLALAYNTRWPTNSTQARVLTAFVTGMITCCYQSPSTGAGGCLTGQAALSSQAAPPQLLPRRR